MKQLTNGSYFGTRKTCRKMDGILLTDLEFDGQQEVPWHYHEQAYFSCFLKGQLLEENKKGKVVCSPGTVLFNNSEEPHRNTDHTPYTRHFHIEIADAWFAGCGIDKGRLQASMKIENPLVGIGIRKIYREFRLNDNVSDAAVEDILMQTMGRMLRAAETEKPGMPSWVKKVKEIIHDRYAENISLHDLAGETGLHPVYLSQQFSKYFQVTFGEYLRRTRVEQSALCLEQKNIPLAEIAYRCGFSDQSHFIRCFKSFMEVTPARYRMQCA